MNIVMISPEITPFAKTGGLADVVGTLGLALERRGHALRLIMPAYRAVLQGRFERVESAVHLSVQLSGQRVDGSVLQGRLGDAIAVHFIRADELYDREALYGTAAGDYPDNAKRYVFFCRAALELLRSFPVDVLHCHDWQSAFAIVAVKGQPELYPELAGAKTVLTIHNLGFQGIFWEPDWHLLHLDRRWFTPRHLEFYGNINLLKGAITLADKITTVSPTYAEEILNPEQGFGLEGVLRDRASDLVGILNGVDYNHWSPETDPFIAKRYNESTLSAKRACKRHLQASVRLPTDGKPALFGVISRLTPQKGIDLIREIFDELTQRNVQLVVLGSGEAGYEEFFAGAAARFPEKVAVRLGFDEALAHRIEAGADLFLMPSHYEPCGLNQMFSLRYGTIPIVRAVGGLKDTVEDYNAENGTGTGFVFEAYEPPALLQTIDRALRVYENKRAWTALRRRAMAQDFSWDRSAAAFDALYRQVLGGQRARETEVA
jgi:starch synthase